MVDYTLQLYLNEYYLRYDRKIMKWYTLYHRPNNIGMGLSRFKFVLANSIIEAAKQFDENTNYTVQQFSDGSLAKPFVCNGGASELVVLEGKQGHL